MRTTTPNTMDPEKILNDCRDLLDGTVSVDSYGERALYYNPCGKLKRGIYILTIKEKDGPNDKSSRLDRDKIFRLSIGVRRSTFVRLFGSLPLDRAWTESSTWMQISPSPTAYSPPDIRVDGLDLRIESVRENLRNSETLDREICTTLIGPSCCFWPPCCS